MGTEGAGDLCPQFTRWGGVMGGVVVLLLVGQQYQNCLSSVRKGQKARYVLPSTYDFTFTYEMEHKNEEER